MFSAIILRLDWPIMKTPEKKRFTPIYAENTRFRSICRYLNILIPEGSQ